MSDTIMAYPMPGMDLADTLLPALKAPGGRNDILPPVSRCCPDLSSEPGEMLSRQLPVRS